LVQLLHAFSFCGAFVQATLIVMLIAFNPNFIRDVAARENRSVTITWLVNVWINWLPPVWVTLDLFLHHDDLKERHKLYFVCDDQSLKFVFILSLMKALWMFLSVPILVLIWRLVVANNLSVAYAVDANYSLLIPTLLLVNAISTLVLVLSVRGRLRRPETVKLLRD
jgi:hypothetical protein